MEEPSNKARWPRCLMAWPDRRAGYEDKITFKASATDASPFATAIPSGRRCRREVRNLAPLPDLDDSAGRRVGAAGVPMDTSGSHSGGRPPKAPDAGQRRAHRRSPTTPRATGGRDRTTIPPTWPGLPPRARQATQRAAGSAGHETSARAGAPIGTQASQRHLPGPLSCPCPGLPARHPTVTPATDGRCRAVADHVSTDRGRFPGGQETGSRTPARSPTTGCALTVRQCDRQGCASLEWHASSTP